MSESIQFRGPLEVEGPDDLDDDDNYMRPGMETTSLSSRKQKEQPQKKSLYIAIAFFFLGLFYFYLSYESPQRIISEYSTLTTFNCARDEFWTKQGCEQNELNCELSVEKTGQCVLCKQNYTLSLEGKCLFNCEESNGQFCSQNIMVSNIFKSLETPNFEIPYIIKYKEEAQSIVYILESQLFALTKYENITSHLVKFDDYYLLNNKNYHSAFADFLEFIEHTMLNLQGTITRTFVVYSDKAQGLLYYFKENRNPDINIIMVQTTLLDEETFYEERYEIQNFTYLLNYTSSSVKLLYTDNPLEDIPCKKSGRNLEETNNKVNEIECLKVEAEKIIESIVQP